MTGNDNQNVWQSLWTEYAEQGPQQGMRWTDAGQFDTIFSLIRRWLDTRDPAFMDEALIYCEAENLPIQPALLRHVSEAAKLRLSRSNAPNSRLEREGNKGAAFRIMANLKACGVTLARASEVASVWTFDQGLRGIKASTLERDYSRNADFVFLENEMREFWDRDPNGEAMKAQWLAIVRDSRAITEDEKGEAR